VSGPGARVAAWVVAAAVGVFCFLPVVLVVLFSFNSVASTSLPFAGFSLRWYEALWNDPEVQQAVQRSVTAAIVTVVVDLLAGTAAAFALRTRTWKWQGAVSGLFMFPLVLPGLFLGVALLAFFTSVGIGTSLRTAIVGHILVTAPVVVIVVGARLGSMDRALMEAARDLGAGPVVAFRKVLLPLLAPTLIGSALLVTAWSFDEFVVTLFTTGTDTTVPVLIYSRVRQGLDPSINALATLVLTVTIGTAVIAAFLLRPKRTA
jgi:spermidine/putrescine transport system permease protein